MIQLSPGRKFYNSLSLAIERGDLAALESFYRHDAVQVDVGSGQVFTGRAAIVAAAGDTIAAAGPVRLAALEKIAEYGEAIGVEARVATRNEEFVIYDLFVLEAGAVRYQVTGTIAPRQLSAGQHGHAPDTAEHRFYARFHAAQQAADYAQLRTLYRPDAVVLFPSAGVVMPGREAILEMREKNARNGGASRRKAMVDYRDAPAVICAEEVANVKPGVPEHVRNLLSRGLGVSVNVASTSADPGYDVLSYEVLILRSGAVRYQFGGMIKPRLEELAAMSKQRADAIRDAWQTSNRMWANERR
ncbi:MAG TPA: hypothetical protein VKV38_01980 [Trebonia sp.]|jgi:ketosteroid isomerase-like protein|nr:hypothetical protein [Trebonia sp.]